MAMDKKQQIAAFRFGMIHDLVKALQEALLNRCFRRYYTLPRSVQDCMRLRQPDHLMCTNSERLILLHNQNSPYLQ